MTTETYDLLFLPALAMAEKAAGQKRSVPLKDALQLMAAQVDLGDELPGLEDLTRGLLQQGDNCQAKLGLGRLVRLLDATKERERLIATEPFSEARRRLSLEVLGLPLGLYEDFQSAFPIAQRRHAIVIADEHEEWYSEQRASQGEFYWPKFREYLRTTAGWPEESVLNLEESSKQILERISDPERPEVYATKGLVVGYVQSGKTANFTAVIARAVDAGYRLVIVLAGTLNILRRQTQRRLDKELVGKEVLRRTDEGAGHEYTDDKDWDDFISYGALPSDLDFFDFQRLTGLDDDYDRLGRAISALEPKLDHPGRRANHPDVLHKQDAKLIVIKKNTTVLRKLITDLGRLKTKLEEVPALVIDDESDQASLNTNPNPKEVSDRSTTNAAIVELLGVLPRAQYIGYTATPFANVFVDPTDAEDLFPKDFIVALGRPPGYMGVRDFFDFDDHGLPLDGDAQPEGFRSNERAFIRSVYEEDTLQQNLPRAILSYVLAGAIKLYRAAHGAKVSTTHHTMLVHMSHKQADHERDAALVSTIFDAQNFGRRQSYEALKSLFEGEFLEVTQSQDPNALLPEKLEELKPFLDECVTRINAGGKPFAVVNGDPRFAEDNPDFDLGGVWKILVGGTKLSRGYTVEGLTVSYYRRRASTADTLMQMGRWFGFRHGYRDLVRLFLGRDEKAGAKKKGRSLDLFEAYLAVCRDEEEFRGELERYSDPASDSRIRPRDVPPLVPSHLLPPTSKTKMFNATIEFENFGGRWLERVLAPADTVRKSMNSKLARELMGSAVDLGRVEFKSQDTSNPVASWRAEIFRAGPESVRDFLENYRWLPGKKPLQRVLEFLDSAAEQDIGVDQWLVAFPQIKSDKSGYWLSEQRFRLIVRSRLNGEDDSGFRVYSEPRDRVVAEWLTSSAPSNQVPGALTPLRSARQAVLTVYTVVEREHLEAVRRAKTQEDRDQLVTIGFGLQFPANGIPAAIRFGVRDSSQADSITIA